jgi:glucokinase
MSDPVPAAIGLDVGGHGIKGVLAAADGRVLARDREEIDGAAERGVAAVEGRIAALVDRLRNAAPGGAVAASLPVGAGIPGFLDRRDGVLRSSPNFPEWNEIPVARRLSSLLACGVVAENDANCALLGEVWSGAARGERDVLMLTLGTGVGSGFLVDGVLLRGHRGSGAEAGHVALYPGGRRCGCGRNGCLETYASGPGLLQTAREAWIEEGGKPARFPLRSARDVFEADAAAGGPESGSYAGRAIERFCLDLAQGLASLVHCFSPGAIVLGGGMAAALPRFQEPLEAALRARAIPACLGDALPLRRAALGELSGALGAAGLALGALGPTPASR